MFDEYREEGEGDGDCWPANAVRVNDEAIALIDWDGAGIGPVILDSGYLLLTCHLDVPQLPAMRPDKPRIAAVVQGYYQHRVPTKAELEVLSDALLYDTTRRTGLQLHLSSLIDDAWVEEVWLQKMLVRYRVCLSIAEIARHLLEEQR